MREFFQRLFGSQEARPVPSQGSGETRAPVEKDDLAELRENRFREALSAVMHETVDDTRFARARAELSKGGSFPRLSGEEIRAAAIDIAERFGWNPTLVPPENPELEYTPGSEPYEPMGLRQRRFEETLAQELGGALTKDQISLARQLFAADASVAARWNGFIGEETDAYARAIAKQLKEAGNRKESIAA